MTLMDFYLSANTIRELVLGLCRLSNQVFEISLNSSLVTDELSSLDNNLKSYAVYSEKMNLISNSLGSSAKDMLKHATRIMELSLEKTKFCAHVIKLEEGGSLIVEGHNAAIVTKSIQNLLDKMRPLDTEAADVLGSLDIDLRNFGLEIKKLWLLSTNLKTQVEFDEIAYLSNINLKIELSLQNIDETTAKLMSQLSRLGRNV
jgi:hypothetical protein